MCILKKLKSQKDTDFKVDILENVNFEILDFTDETGTVKNIDKLQEEPYHNVTDLEGFFYFRDEELEESPGSVVLRAPSSYSWGSIVTGLLVIGNLLFAATSYYFSQSAYNQATTEKIVLLDDRLEDIENQMYSKRESDLMYSTLENRIDGNRNTIENLRDD